MTEEKADNSLPFGVHLLRTKSPCKLSWHCASNRGNFHKSFASWSRMLINNWSASKHRPHMLYNLGAHSYARNSTRIVPILTPTKPRDTSPPGLLIFILIAPAIHAFVSSLQVSRQKFRMHFSPFHVCHLSNPSHISRFQYDIWWELHLMKFLKCNLSN